MPLKLQSILLNMGVSFHEAASVFDEPNSTTGYDLIIQKAKTAISTAGIYSQVVFELCSTPIG